ncbi:MAG: low molecular weight phosphotyrosine protein phosphatase [Gammaproteobacteria bacterium]|nr:low molecular weight phosphotyrosine protein phosphatase [Gammaproteobacteria bacterium]
MAVSILFVCLGNICRSPTAEGIFRHMVREQGLHDRIQTDSCGTAGYHIGAKPDKRSLATAQKRGYDFSDLRARKLEAKDLDRFDHILVMDKSNLDDTLQLANESNKHKVQLFLSYHTDNDIVEVPDPYYGGPDGFEHVVDLIEDASANLLKSLK